jgi:hypothetical protein
MTNRDIEQILCEQSILPQVSSSTIASIREKLGFQFLPPIHTFYLTEKQKSAQFKFATDHLHDNWDEALFTDESFFWLGDDSRRLYRRRGEFSEDVQFKTPKFQKKILIFGGIAKRYKTPLIIIESGTVDAITYIDDLFDQSGLIPDMNSIYGSFKWKLMQDGTSAHTAEETMEYLSLYCQVLQSWPSGSPDLNLIENLWAIMKTRVADLDATTVEELISAILTAWESITETEIEHLIDSMNDRLSQVLLNNGGQNGY